MPRHPLDQTSFFDPEAVDPRCLDIGTVPWLLARAPELICPAWLFVDWSGEGRRGRNAWPARVLVGLIVMRWCGEGMSRRAAVRQARTDTRWRAAMGLPIGGATPSLRTVRRFERFLAARDPKTGVERHVLLHEHIVRVCLDRDVVTDPKWSTDSTPMWAYGAVLDTVRLLGDGLRSAAQHWARHSGASVVEVGDRWGAPWVTAKSTKGAFCVEWRDQEARAEVLDQLARGVCRAVKDMRERIGEVHAKKRKPILRRCAHLLRVITSDMETDEKGRLVVAKRVAKDRLVSMTDPQARHGRKSKSKRFDGFKLHLVGDLASGLIASVTVTAGNSHDNVVAHRLIRRAKNLVTDIDRILGDTAYGGAGVRHRVRKTLGVEIVAPPPPIAALKGRFGRADFHVDFENNVVTCPNGVAAPVAYTTSSSALGKHIPVHKWERAACANCPLRARCRGEQKGPHKVLLHPHEKELREARAQWADPAVRAEYRERSQCERLVNQMTRHGGRLARAWGLSAANQQAHLIAAACNLALLARRLAAEERRQAAA